jgi:hypothetical protein
VLTRDVLRSLGFALAYPVALVAALATTGDLDADAKPAQAVPRIIDRAFLCTNATRSGGVRDIGMGAKTGFRSSGTWKWLANAGILNRGTTPTTLGANQAGQRPTVLTHWGLGFSAGAGTTDPAARPHLGYFHIWSKWAKACESVPVRRVPLSARGLPGGRADYFGDGFTCPAPRRVFVRVRGVFSKPASLRLDRATLQLTTDAPVQQASFAVRIESGKPLAYASVNESGKARIFAAPSCVPD